MESMLSGWIEDLEPPWQELLNEAQLGFEQMDPSLTLKPWEPVFPVRRQQSLLGTPSGGHIFRALDGIHPDNVRCILLGQDPFPCPAFSTGRAFESGNVANWRELEKITFSPSMRCFVQSVCTARTGNPAYCSSIQSWGETIGAIERKEVDFPKPTDLFDNWLAQGVLALNTSLTITRFEKVGDPHQLDGHLPLWWPLLLDIITGLAKRSQQTILVLAFGKIAEKLVQSAQETLSETDSEYGDITPIYSPHPAAGETFLAAENPFLLANTFLNSMGLRPIDW